MNAPRRWLDDGAQLPPSLLGAMRDAPASPSPDELHLLAHHLSSTLGVPLLPTATTAIASGAVKAQGLWALAGWILGGVAGGLGVSSLVALTAASLDPPPTASPMTRPVPTSSPSHRIASRPSPLVPPPPAEPAQAPPSVVPTAPAPLRNEPTLPSVPDPTSTPNTELSLLRAAQAALADAPGHALALCSRHAEQYPNGTLAQERDVIAIDALLRLGRVDEASARARVFEARYPGSAHSHRLREQLERAR